jgi:trk system potassium uptake protein TrkA
MTPRRGVVMFRFMKILIIGDGKVGYTLAEQLSMENHDVTIVDNNEKALSKAVENLDVLCIQGSGSSRTTLQEANVGDKDLVIAVTSSDEINMVCCLLSRKLSDARIIARIRNPEYMESEDFIEEAIGIDMQINPELTAAEEISRLLRFPHAISRESLADGRIEFIEFALNADSPILGVQLLDVMPKLRLRTLICLVSRGGEIFTANGATVLEDDDHIFIAGTPEDNMAFARYLGYKYKKIRTVMIVGGSRIAHYLAERLEYLGMNTKIIELDMNRCEKLHQFLPDSVIINGDGTDHELLKQEQIELMDAFVALTDRDEENILAGLYAQDCEVPKVIVKVTRPYYNRIVGDLSTINPKDLTASLIVRYVRSMVNSEGSFLESLYRVAHGGAEAMQFTAGASARMLQKPLSQLKLRKGLLVAAIIHKGHVTIPGGNDVIHEGDKVVIVTSENRMFIDINDIMGS